MGRADYFAAGKWNVRCDQCGEKYKSSELKRQWNGLMTCWRCWEPRNQQEMIRPVPDMQAIPWSRPSPAPRFVNGAYTPYPGILDGSTLDGSLLG